MPDYPVVPAVILTGQGSGRELRFDEPGTTTLVLCINQETQKAAEAIEEALRHRWPRAEELLIAYLVDLRRVPGLFRSLAENVLEAEYKKALDTVPDGQKPQDYVIILPDWQGEAVQALGFVDLTNAPGIAVLTAGGRLAGTLAGTDVGAIEKLIEDALQG